MWHFQRIDPLQLFPFKYISVVGAGGKTTLTEYLAHKLIKNSRSVAITTTTKIYAREPYIIIDETGIKEDSFKKPLIRVGKTLEQDKLTALAFDEIRELGAYFDVVLVEADGAKGCSLKFPAHYEPVIPPFSESIVILAGLDSLFRRVDEKVFRWELMCVSEGLRQDDIITSSVFLNFFSDHILFKGVDRKKSIVVLNKYDRVSMKSTAMEVAKKVVIKIPEAHVIVSSLLYDLFYGINHIQFP